MQAARTPLARRADHQAGRLQPLNGQLRGSAWVAGNSISQTGQCMLREDAPGQPARVCYPRSGQLRVAPLLHFSSGLRLLERFARPLQAL